MSSYLENIHSDVVETISFKAVFGDEEIEATLTFQVYGGYGYNLKAGNIKGKFIPTRVFGWQYDGDALELDDIQILLDRIFEANNFDDEDDRNFNANIMIPHVWRRDILTREEYNQAAENSRHFDWRSEGAYFMWNGKAY